MRALRKRGFWIVAAAYLIIGLILAIRPQVSIRILFGAIGIILFLIGVVCILSYFRREVEAGLLSAPFAIGVVLAALGIAVYAKADAFASILPVVLGILLLLGAVFQLQNVMDLLRAGGVWLVPAIGTAISIVLGIILLQNPFGTVVAFFRIAGVFLILESLIHLFCGAALTRRAKGRGHPSDYIDADQ